MNALDITDVLLLMFLMLETRSSFGIGIVIAHIPVCSSKQEVAVIDSFKARKGPKKGATGHYVQVTDI